MKKRLNAPASKRAVEDQLARYREMRDFSQTAEPSGAPGEKKPNRKADDKALPFVIQKHAATRLHYDFRLGWDGVLKSWAVAKGPSYFPGDKRLAVQVEDHPIEYGGFEGTIPKGQYGGGTVMIWDQGTWGPIGDAEEGFKKGNLKFNLNGKKMRGKWALIRMGGKMAQEAKPNWLLIKEHDAFEQAAGEVPVTEKESVSVVTGRDLDEIAEDADHVWNSKESRNESVTASGKKNQKVKAYKLPSNMKDPPKEAVPKFIAPQLAMQATSPPQGQGWLHEIKMDGYRIQAVLRSGSRDRVQLLTRKGLDWTARMKAIAAAVESLPVTSAVLDGEVVVFRKDGTTDFAELQAAFQEGAGKPLNYVIFDLLHLNGRNLRDLPLEDRKRVLADLLEVTAPTETLRFSEHLGSDGYEIFRSACELGAEGIVSKRAAAKYSSGRSDSWLKAKCYREQEMVIGGYTDLSNGMRGVGALLLGYYKNGKLIYGGRTGTGFTHKTHHMMRDRLEKLARKTSPFETVPRAFMRGAKWVAPELVAAVSFSNWTKDNLMRQAAFKGLREDKPATEVIREEAMIAAGEKSEEPDQASSKKKRGSYVAKLDDSKNKEKARGAVERKDHLPIRLTHPDKVVDTESAVTKRLLAEYYLSVAERMLPHIANRPLSLVRCPEGSGNPCFFQKHANKMLPEKIGSVDVVDPKTGKSEPYITLSTADALASLAQIGVLEIHPWGSQNDSLEKPDRLIFDLDPDGAIDWKTLGGAALDFRRRLRLLGLDSYLKTTGGKGLHVVVPIRPEHEWPDVKRFAHEFVLAMERDEPSKYLTKMTKSARTGKIYLDYLRNDRGATSVAPYSPRARAGLAVSLPLSWKELKDDRPPRFHVADFAAWKKRLARDPWDGWQTNQKLPLGRETKRASRTAKN